MKSTFYSFEQFSGLVNEICRQISLDQWRPDYIIGITRGGLLPAVMISQYFNIPMYTVKISLRDGVNDCEHALWVEEDISQGKKILVVDDINDEGNTLNWIINDWNVDCESDNVRFAVVIDNIKSQAKIKVDYFGVEVDKEETGWIIFPYENWWLKSGLI